MTDEEDNDVIDPFDLDPETLRAIEKLVRGYPDASPAVPPEESSEYRAGRRDALNAVLARITQWLDEIEHDTDRNSGADNLDSEGER